MTALNHPDRSKGASRDSAQISIKIGQRVAFDARATSAGLLSIGAVVSGILLSNAVIVFVGERKRAMLSDTLQPVRRGG